MVPARFTARLFSRFLSAFRFWKWREPGLNENPEHWLGRRGETLAARFLRAHRYKILYRNFRPPRGGEVDLVCRQGDTLVFVEVKTRSSVLFGRPAEAVNLEKQKLITRGALAWLRMLDHPDILFRFDIVEVVIEQEKPVLSLIQDAFQLPDRYIY